MWSLIKGTIINYAHFGRLHSSASVKMNHFVPHGVISTELCVSVLHSSWQYFSNPFEGFLSQTFNHSTSSVTTFNHFTSAIGWSQLRFLIFVMPMLSLAMERHSWGKLDWCQLSNIESMQRKESGDQQQRVETKRISLIQLRILPFLGLKPADDWQWSILLPTWSYFQ